MKTTNNTGFTLVEVIVASLLIMVMAGAGITVFLLYTNNSRDLGAHLKLQQQYETVVEEIAFSVRNAEKILSQDVRSVSMNGPDTAWKSVNSVQMDIEGDTAGFSLGLVGSDTTRLYERVNGTWVPMVIGGQDVFINRNLCTLKVYPGNTELEIALSLYTVQRDTFSLPPREERYRCRN